LIFILIILFLFFSIKNGCKPLKEAENG
jgi:hypothetical protein